MGADSRIGHKFLNAGIGYGGSCFPKDTNALAYMANKYGVQLGLVEKTIRGNYERRLNIAERINSQINEIGSDAHIAVLGLAFKNGTDDIRYSPAIDIIRHIQYGSIYAYDPQAMKNAATALGDNIAFSESVLDCIKDADIIIILTEWPEFRELENIDFNRPTIILDYRNLLDENIMCSKSNVKYKQIGK